MAAAALGEWLAGVQPQIVDPVIVESKTTKTKKKEGQQHNQLSEWWMLDIAQPRG